MTSGFLAGRTILLVEDEPLIALDICDCLQGAGASVLSAHTLSAGLRLASHPEVSVAVVDFRLGDGDGTAICDRLKDRGVPFVLYSGYDTIAKDCGAGIVLPKPATPEQLIGSVVRALHHHERDPIPSDSAGVSDVGPNSRGR
jgi:DNA-binding response OmpR family regulator